MVKGGLPEKALGEKWGGVFKTLTGREPSMHITVDFKERGVKKKGKDTLKMSGGGNL